MAITSSGDHARIDGKIYSLGQCYDTKTEAKREAIRVRRMGNLARVTKFHDSGRKRIRYGVYVRSKS